MPEMKNKPPTQPKNRKTLLYSIGNLLITLSFLGFIGIFSPLLFIYFSPPKIKNIETLKGYTMTIPKINAQSEVIDNVDPWNEAMYAAALKHGIAHAKGFSEPGEKGLIYFFAHSSGLPWELTRYNTIFLKLGELQNGDQIFITYQNKKYVYSVIGKETVWPNDVRSVVGKKNQNELVLQTCTPIGTALQRLLIFATPLPV